MIKNKFMMFFTTITLEISLLFTSQVNAASQSRRLSGLDRYETCASIVQDGWQGTSDYAVIVNGENFPDSLSASTLAKKYNAPILLTQNDKLNSNTYNQLKRLNVKEVFIVGGDFVIKPVIEQAIKSMGIKTTRYAGQDRNETSVKIAEQIGISNGLILTTDSDFVDALSIAPIAANLQIPIVLVPKNTIPDSIKNLISSKKISQTYILGDDDIISDSIANCFPNVSRIVGSDKYERNINIINTFRDKLNFCNIYFAYSEEFADSLSGSAIAAVNDNPIVLIGNNISSITSKFIDNHIGLASQITILGGNAGITDNEVSTIFCNSHNSILTGEGPIPTYIMWNKHMYNITGERVKNIGNKIGTPESTNLDNVNFDVYSILGSNSDKEIAVKGPSNLYFRAVSK